MRSIILSGKQGSGKTTLAKMFASVPHFYYVRFASVIYEMHNAVLDIGRKYGIKKDLDKTLLQLLGTEWGRETLHKDVWVSCLQKKVALMQRHDPNAHFIIDDCRFPNELSAFPNFLKIRLECDRDIRKERVSQWRDNENHVSETALDSNLEWFDYVIDTGRMDAGTLFNLVYDYANIKTN